MPSLTRNSPDAGQPGPSSRVRERCSCPSPRGVRVLGYVRRGRGTRMDCAQPLRVVCGGCGEQEHWRCNVSAESKCSDCAERRRKQLARIVDHGITTRAGKGFIYFLTLTSPGDSEHLQWRQGKGGTDRPPCDCHRVWEERSKGEWNAGESKCWNRLRLALSRLTGGQMAYIGSVEVQKRGMLHRHVVLHAETPLLPSEVGPLALAAGYGCVHDLQPIESASKAAWYVSKYVTKSSGQRGDVPWRADVVDSRTGEVRQLETVPTFRTWSASQSWGFTLKGLREIAQAQAHRREMYLRELETLLAEGEGSSPAAVAGLARAALSGTPPP